MVEIKSPDTIYLYRGFLFNLLALFDYVESFYSNLVICD